MVKVIDLCTNCVQVITNPVCSHCFSNHVALWLRDRNIHSYELFKIKKLLRDFVVLSEGTPSDIKCILCGSQRVNVCAYCFINNTEKIIEKIEGNTETLNDFNEDFHKEIWIDWGVVPQKAL